MEEEECDEEKWKKERIKVLDEWSEIELRGKDALKPDVVHEPGTIEGVMSLETPLQDLYPLLIGPEPSAELLQQPETSTPSTSSTLDRIIQICLCRPIKSDIPPLVYTHKTLMIKLSQTPYDNENGTHWLLLSDYFQSIAQLALEKTDTPCTRVGAHWQTVGFQGSNPATDFRGCGVLALLQLHSFTQRLPQNILKAVVDLSRLEPNDFPLAVVSINMTGLILSRLKKDRLDTLGNQTDGLFPIISALHAACIAEFCAQYKSQNLTLAQCQSVISTIEQMLEKSPRSLLCLLDPANDDIVKRLL